MSEITCTREGLEPSEGCRFHLSRKIVGQGMTLPEALPPAEQN